LILGQFFGLICKISREINYQLSMMIIKRGSDLKAI
jgi:hypothetical protein